MQQIIWISTTDSLPPNKKNVLIYSKHGVAEGELDIANNQWVQYRWSAKIPFEDVTHWSPLPTFKEIK